MYVCVCMYYVGMYVCMYVFIYVCVCVYVLIYVRMYGLGTPVDGCLVIVRSVYHKTVTTVQIFIKTKNFILWFIKQLFMTKLHIFQYHNCR